MGDVYIEIGDVKAGAKITADQKKAAEPVAKAALADWVAHAGGTTTVKPKDGKGVKLGVMLMSYVSDKNGMTCKLVGDVFDLPGGERKQLSARTLGEATVKGGVEDCTKAAVVNLMSNIGSGLAAAPLTAAQMKVIYVAPHEIVFKTGAKASIVADATPKLTTMLDDLVKAVPRLTLGAAGASDFVAGMTAYKMHVKVGVTIDTTAKTADLTLQCDLYKYPGDALFGNSTGPAKASLSGDIRDATIVGQIIDVAKPSGQRAVKAIP